MSVFVCFVCIYLSTTGKDEADSRPPAGRPSGFLTGYCDVSFHPIDLAFVSFVSFDRTPSNPTTLVMSDLW